MTGRHRTIKFKLLAAIIPAFALFGFITVGLVSNSVQSSFRKDLERNQLNLVTLIASKLDDQLESYHKSLIGFAATIPFSALGSPAALEELLDGRPTLRQMFDNNILIFTPEGRLVAETGQRPSRSGTDFSFRDYIRETRAQRKPYISAPFESKLPHRPPVLMFTAPIIDPQGVLRAIVGGSINLLRPNLLGRLAGARIGENGYFYLSTAERLMVMHPDRTRLLKEVGPPGQDPLYDRSIRGFEGAGETTAPDGTLLVAAYKRLRTVNWILAAQQPAAEAYAAVNKARLLAWAIAVAAVALLALLTYLAASRLLAPLQELTEQVQQLKGADRHRPVTAGGDDELGRLGRAFNDLLQQLKEREQELQSSRERFQFISDVSQDWIFWREPGGALQYVSPSAERISGYGVDELMRDPGLVVTMIHPDDREAWQQHVCSAESGAGAAPIEYRIFTREGELRWLRHSCVSVTDRNGRLLGIRGSNRDITERKLALLQLQENEERFRLIADAAHDAIIMTDPNRRVVFWNRAAERLFGCSAAAAVGSPLAVFLPGLIDAMHQNGAMPDEGLTLEQSGRSHDGRHLDLELAVSWGRLSGTSVTVILGRDIADRKRAEEQLRFISSHDALSGLSNRAAFEFHLKRLDREGPFPVAVLIADLDGLKLVNDSRGHEEGDRLIQAAAELLTSAFRTNDIVARIGGDEFAVLLPGIPEEIALNKLERLQRRVELYNELPENPQVSLSCGMAHALAPGGLAQAVVLADQEMYRRKFALKKQYEAC